MAAQIRKMLEASKCKGKEEEKECQELYWLWLSGCGEKGVHAVGEEVRMLPRDSSVVRGSRVSSVRQSSVVGSSVIGSSVGD